MVSQDSRERRCMRPTSKTSGFTVVELIVGITITALMLAGIIVLIVNVIGVGSRSIETTKQVNQAQDALAMIRDDLTLTSKFLVTSSIPDTRPGGGSWNFRGSGAEDRVLILRTLATTAHKSNIDREPSYKQSGGCPIGNEPAYNNVVYFVRDDILYRRIIVEPPTTGMYCAGQENGQVRTCTDPSSGSAPSNCDERDVVVAENITGFDILYYDHAGDEDEVATIYDSSSTQGTLDARSTVEVALQTNKQIDGQNNEYETHIRATRSQEN